ncbi:MAG TPA: (d)CMP kinase [Paracoccaceae bacterium]|nr:(d)CMP kinase [Paracoccaceae bacterium]
MKFVVAIDGPAAAGKGTIARAVAARFGFAHLDTGLLYRAVGAKALETSRGVIDEGMAELIAGRLSEADLARPDLRTARVAQAASRVAAMPGVRRALLDFQRRFAARDGGAVLDGRDIGTVVCPDADMKFFVTASDEVRAARRYEELSAAGAATTLERVAAELRQRDLRDAGRSAAPLARAEDAVLLDTSELSIDAAVTKAVAVIEQRLQGRIGQGRG